MKIGFQEKPWDLFLTLIYTEFATAIVVSLGSGNLGTILLAIFAPGYVTTGVLFPEDNGLHWIERLAVSLGLSVVVVPFIGLMLWISGIGLGLFPILAALAIYTNSVGAVAYARRSALPIDRRLSLSLEIHKAAWERQGLLDKTLTIITVVSILAAVGTLAYVAVAPKPAEHYTEFFIAYSSFNITQSPTRLNASEPASVVLGLANHEGQTTGYQLRIDLVGLQIVYNKTSNENQSVETNRTTLTWINITVPGGESWTQSYGFSIAEIGLWKVQFLLHKGPDLTTPYRELHLYVLIVAG